MSSIPPSKEPKLTESEQEQFVLALESEKKKFADTYKRWADASSGARKEVDPAECMYGKCILSHIYFIIYVKNLFLWN